jgi:hypothetical protein
MGPPGRLRLVSGGSSANGAAFAAVHLPDALAPYLGDRPSVVRRGDDPARARLRLPRNTPPGQYGGSVELADGRREAVNLTVERRPRVRVTPGTLHLSGAAGAAVQAGLLLENRGNVPLEIDEALVTGVFDDNGIETALAAAYRLQSDDLNLIVSTVFSRLREAHGGLLKLRVVEGAGTLAAGERRLLLLETTLGAKLQPGHGYHGVLKLGGHAIAVRLHVTENPSPVRPGGKR